MPKILSNAKTQRNKYGKYLSFTFLTEMCVVLSVGYLFVPFFINLSSEAEYKTICKTLTEVFLIATVLILSLPK